MFSVTTSIISHQDEAKESDSLEILHANASKAGFPKCPYRLFSQGVVGKLPNVYHEQVGDMN